MKGSLVIGAVAALVTAAPAGFADEHADGCALSYETFETAVPHTDLEECPASMQVEDAFCRASVVAEVATIFAFSYEDSCIIASKSYFDDEFTFTVE